MPKRLTEQQIEQYHRDGFVSPVRVMSEDEAIALRKKMEAFEATQGKPIHGAQKTKCTLLFPFMYDLFTGDAVLDAVEDLIGPDILQYQCGVWIKEPEAGSYVSWHQDSTYYGMDPLDLVSRLGCAVSRHGGDRVHAGNTGFPQNGSVAGRLFGSQ
jgi:hypothetical protein